VEAIARAGIGNRCWCGFVTGVEAFETTEAALRREGLSSAGAVGSYESLRNNKRLTNREVLWITNICFVRFEDSFPPFR
jgi:hypothetical protein